MWNLATLMKDAGGGGGGYEGEEGGGATGPDDHARVQEYCHQGWKLGNQTSIL